MPTKILIVDDHPLMLEVVERVVCDAISGASVFRAGDLTRALKILDEEGQFDLVLLDLHLPDTVGLSALLEIRNLAPQTKILVLTGREQARAKRIAFLLGASGFVSKSSEEAAVVNGVRRLTHLDCGAEVFKRSNGQADSGLSVPPASQEKLTPKQVRILKMLCDGQMNKILAYNLDVTESTAKAHVSAIIKKFGVMSRTQVILEVVGHWE